GGIMSSFFKPVAVMAASALLAWSSQASAWVTCGAVQCYYSCACTGYMTQSDGCPIPQMNPGGVGCSTNDVQTCLDIYEGSPGVINACADDSTDLQTFVPACTMTVRVIAEGGIKQLAFGWYNKVTNGCPLAADLHQILPCAAVPCSGTSNTLVGKIGVLPI